MRVRLGRLILILKQDPPEVARMGAQKDLGKGGQAGWTFDVRAEVAWMLGAVLMQGV